MGTSARSAIVGSPKKQLIMKQFVVLLAFVSPLALAEAEASYGLHGGALGYAGAVGVAAAPVAVAAAPVAVAQRVATAPHCQTTYDTITSQQCTTVSEPVCCWLRSWHWCWCWCHWWSCRCWCCRLWCRCCPRGCCWSWLCPLKASLSKIFTK